MTQRRASRPAALLAAALLLAACGGGARSAPAPAPAPGSTAPPSAAGPTAAEVEELEALFRARQESARSRYTEADVAFMTGMIAHHAQALVMSAMAPTHGASPTVRTLAARITNAQRDEIATMQRWLRDRDQPVPEVHEMGGEIMVHGAGHHEHMPGMLTPEQIAQLDAARGPEFDRLFLTFMIQHHQGAVGMVRELFATDGAGQDEEIFKFASDVQVDQATEVARMELMLSELTAGGPGR